MTHAIDFDSIESRLFTLHHVALGSEAFCGRFRISREWQAPYEYEWEQYVGQLKALVSGTMIDAAIKIRMLQDFARAEDKSLKVGELLAEASAGLDIGKLDGRTEKLSLRESCNKIIHATSTNLVWLETKDVDGSFEHWTGVSRFYGAEQSGKEWAVSLVVPDWCTAMSRFVIGFQEKVDWARAMKWAE